MLDNLVNKSMMKHLLYYNHFYKNSIKHPIKFTTEQEKLIVKIVDEISDLD